MEFWIEIQNTAGTRLGEIHQAVDWENSVSLDRAGTFRFSMAASDPNAALIAAKRVAVCYAILDDTITEIGSGVIDEISLTVDAGGNLTGLLEVSGYDRLIELASRTVGNLVIGPSAAVTTAPADLIAYAPGGWSLDTTDGYNATAKAIQHTYEGETVLNAFGVLVDLTGEHFRAGVGQSLVWMKNDRPSSEIKAIYGIAPEAIEGADGLCAITNLRRMQDSHDAYIGRVYAYGAGNGDAKITLNGASLPGGYSGYALGNDSKGYYLEHTSNWSSYGIERYGTFKDISLAQTLLEATYEYMKRAASPNQAYDLTLAGLKTLLYPGYTLRVIAHQYVDGYHALNIDDDLVILEAVNRIDNSGLRTISVTCAAIDRWPDDDASATLGGLGQSENYYTHTQPVQADVTGVAVAAGKTLTVNETMTLDADGTGQTYNFPASGGDVVLENNANAFTQDQRILKTTPKILLRDSRSTTWSGGEDFGGIDLETSDASGGGAGVLGRIYAEQVRTGGSTVPGIGWVIQVRWATANSLIEGIRIIPTGTATALVMLSVPLQPASMADSSAPNNSVYYSTTASKLVYKDGSGVVNNLY